MALVVLLRKPPEHGRIVHIRFRAAVPVEEKEIAVTVNGGLLRSLAVLQHASLYSRPVSLCKKQLSENACRCLWSYRIFPFLSCATPILSRRTASHCQWGRNQVYPLPAASSAVRAPLWCYALHSPGGGSASRKARRPSFSFFIISDTDTTYNFIVALAFSQMFNLLCERADNVHGGRLPHHVRVLWDEAANTGQVPSLEKLVAVIRSREVSLTLFYQQLAQCKAIYDKNAETILGNMDSVVFLGGREASTIKEISENWLGKATISMQTADRSRGQSESYNQNTQRLGRELMTPAELATMPGDRCILQLRGLPPFYSRKYDLKQHPNYRYTAEADKKKNAFSLERLICRRIKKLNPNEQYTVYEADVPDETPIDEDEDILNYDDLDDPDAFV